MRKYKILDDQLYVYDNFLIKPKLSLPYLSTTTTTTTTNQSTELNSNSSNIESENKLKYLPPKIPKYESTSIIYPKRIMELRGLNCKKPLKREDENKLIERLAERKRLAEEVRKYNDFICIIK